MFGSFECLTLRTNVLHTHPIQYAHHDNKKLEFSKFYRLYNIFLFIPVFSLSSHLFMNILRLLCFMVIVNNDERRKGVCVSFGVNLGEAETHIKTPELRVYVPNSWDNVDNLGR